MENPREREPAPDDAVPLRPIEQCACLPALTDALWRERATLEHLLYRLVSAKLLLAADERAYVPQALAEVEAAASQVWARERDRQAAVRIVADEWGTSADELTLDAMATQAPDPWATLLREHQQAFRGLAAEIEVTARDNERLAASGLNAIRESLGGLTARDETTYGAHGRLDRRAPGATTIDRVL